MTTIKFSFTNTVQHLHPDLETEIEYIGVARVHDGIVLIKCLTATQSLLIKGAKEIDLGGITEPQCAELEIPETLKDQSWANGAMGRLLGQCRHAALQEVYRQEKAETAIREENEFAPERPDLSKPIMREEMGA